MIRVITDSAADFSVSEAEERGIEFLPMKVEIDGKEYKDGYDITGKEFFEILGTGGNHDLHTSQISPFQFEECFEKYPDDEIICIVMSSKLSSTYQSACIAAEGKKNIVVIDSENVTVGENILVRYCLQLIKKGMSLKDIETELNTRKKQIRLVALLGTLEYLKKGGRISPAVAFIGGILNIRPVISISEGKVKLLGKARGSKAGNNMLRVKTLEGNGVDFNLPYAAAYSGLSQDLLNEYIKDSSDMYPDGTIINRVLIGSTIGTHIGPDAICFSYFEKDK